MPLVCNTRKNACVCVCACGQACVHLCEVVCENNWIEACCRLGVCLEPVLDLSSVAKAQIDVVEIVAVHLPLVWRPLLFQPSTNSRLPPIGQLTCNAHDMLIVVRPPCPASSLVLLCSQERLSTPPALLCRRDSLGCIVTPRLLRLFCTAPAVAAHTRVRCCSSAAASDSGWSSGSIML